MSAQDLARQSVLSVATIRRGEPAKGETSMTAANDLALRRAGIAGVKFKDNDGGPGCDYEERLKSKHGTFAAARSRPQLRRSIVSQRGVEVEPHLKADLASRTVTMEPVP